MACTVRQVNYRGWDALELKNDCVSLAAVPDIGGRLMAYQLGPYSFLYNDPTLAGKLFTPEENQGDGSLAAWKNYGGDKTWPSPQGWENEDQWPGPPDPILDSGRYSYEAGMEAGCAWVRMVSPAGSSTGIQITRQLTLLPASTRVQAGLSFTNISHRRVRWSIWDVVQLDSSRRRPEGRLEADPSCVVTARLNPHSRFPRGFTVMFGEENNPQWTTDPECSLFIGKNLWEIGKVGLDSPGGWVAFSNPSAGFAFSERFSYDPSAGYPDQGATVEFWTVGKGRVANLDYEGSDIYLMETEVLSPFYPFEPGETRTTSIEWGACACTGMVSDVTPAGCVAEPLRVEPVVGGKIRLRGSFGVFDRGELWLSWKDAAGGTVESSSLGPVDPLHPVLLDAAAQVQAPPGATAIWLDVKAASSKSTAPLASASL
ncbi:MAG TPA: hypothetical protein VMT46_03050 [Anaerolineaceae bacterium]|nr:hypothetical protein [Anaerolineaceae bacterium]